jgi:hypothetical protein
VADRFIVCMIVAPCAPREGRDVFRLFGGHTTARWRATQRRSAYTNAFAKVAPRGVGRHPARFHYPVEWKRVADDDVEMSVAHEFRKYGEFFWGVRKN